MGEIMPVAIAGVLKCIRTDLKETPTLSTVLWPITTTVVSLIIL